MPLLFETDLNKGNAMKFSRNLAAGLDAVQFKARQKTGRNAYGEALTAPSAGSPTLNSAKTWMGVFYGLVSAPRTPTILAVFTWLKASSLVVLSKSWSSWMLGKNSAASPSKNTPAPFVFFLTANMSTNHFGITTTAYLVSA